MHMMIFFFRFFLLFFVQFTHQFIWQSVLHSSDTSPCVIRYEVKFYALNHEPNELFSVMIDARSNIFQMKNTHAELMQN